MVDLQEAQTSVATASVASAVELSPEALYRQVVANQVCDAFVLIAGFSVEACRHGWQHHWDAGLFDRLFQGERQRVGGGVDGDGVTLVVSRLDTFPPLVALAQSGHIEAVGAVAYSLAKSRGLSGADSTAFSKLAETAVLRLAADCDSPLAELPEDAWPFGPDGTVDLDALRRDWHAVVSDVVESLNEHADEHDYCTDYESALDRIWLGLSAESPSRSDVPSRPRDFDVSGYVTVSVTLTIPVTARLEAQTREQAVAYGSVHDLDLGDEIDQWFQNGNGVDDLIIDRSSVSVEWTEAYEAG